MAENRNVGGLFCFEVLALLSDYVDGELSTKQREQVELHLEGCDACTKFGGEFGAVVKALPRRGVADEPSEARRRRLLALLP